MDWNLRRLLARYAPDAIPATYRDGELLGYVGRALRRSARLADIDPKLVTLLLAVEDRRFWHHPGVDLLAVGRAIVADVRARAAVQGASTIAQQLLKNTMLSDCAPLLRKSLEIPLAPITTLLLGRTEVLERYLNTVYFGGGLYGVRSAAQVFLGKEPTRLSWAEAALLAGLPASPESFAFYRPNPLARSRRDHVLRRGHQAELISATDLSAAISEPLPAPRSLNVAHRDLLANLMVPVGALTVRTTLDRATHVAATRIARRAASVGWCSIASVDVECGEVRALATRWNDSRVGFDVGLLGAMSPGSALKPFVLSAALDAGYRPTQVFASGTVVLAVDGGTWRVENWRGQAFGSSTLFQATLNSDNTVYARLIAELGHQFPASVLSAAGLPASPSPGPALVLGVLNSGVSPLQVAASYVTLTGADFRPPRLTSDGVSPVPVPPPTSQRARAQVREVLNTLVRTQVSYDLARDGAFGKTGTPDDGRSGWFVGVHEGLATAVVVGSSAQEGPLKARAAAAAWAAFYEELRRVRGRGR